MSCGELGWKFASWTATFWGSQPTEQQSGQEGILWYI